MEKERKNGLEKRIGIWSLAIVSVMVMVMAGLASTVSVTPAEAKPYHSYPGYSPNWVPLEYTKLPWSDEANQWTLFTPEMWILTTPGNYGTVIHCHQLAHMAYWNHTTPVPDQVYVVMDAQTGSMWIHDGQNQNDFPIYPMKSYFIRWVMPHWLWLALNEPPPVPPPPPPPYEYWLTELLIPTGYYTHSAWSELNTGENYIGAYAYDYTTNKPIMASELIEHMYNHDGSTYTGEWMAAHWDGYNGWRVYVPGQPATDWEVHPEEWDGFYIWVWEHCHIVWSA